MYFLCLIEIYPHGLHQCIVSSVNTSCLQVIDMTGREQKVYYSYSQMSNKHSVPDEGPPSMSAQEQKSSGFALPELEHNLQLLIDLTEQDILQV